MRVRDCMSTHPIMIHAHDDYKSAFDVMEHHTLRHLPVLDEHDHLVGMLAERDLLLAATRYLNCAVEVEAVMHADVITTTPDMPLDQAALLMASHHIGGLPVVKANGSGQAVIGIITESDIFRSIGNHNAGAPQSRPAPALTHWHATERRNGDRRNGDRRMRTR
jgi:CBS domain-containing protein